MFPSNIEGQIEGINRERFRNFRAIQEAAQHFFSQHDFPGLFFESLEGFKSFASKKGLFLFLSDRFSPIIHVYFLFYSTPKCEPDGLDFVCALRPTFLPGAHYFQAEYTVLLDFSLP